MASRPDRSPPADRRPSSPDRVHRRQHISYRHVPAPRHSNTSESSLSDDQIDPDDSASAPRGGLPYPDDSRSHVSHRSAAPRAAPHTSRAATPSGGPRPRSPPGRANSQRGVSRERVRIRETTFVNDRRSPPPGPTHGGGAPIAPQRRSSNSSDSVDSETTTSSFGSSSGSSSGRHRYHPGYAPHPRPVRRPSDDYYGGGPGPIVPMAHHDPYYGRGGYGHNYYPPYYRPPPQPAPFVPPPGYHGHELVIQAPPPQQYFYPPQAAPQQPVFINAGAPGSPPPIEDPTYRKLEAELAGMRLEKSQREEAEKAKVAAELARLRLLQAEADARAREEKAISEAEKVAKLKVEKEYADKEAKEKAKRDKETDEKQKKFDELEKKKKEQDDELKALKGDPDNKKTPVRLVDTVLDRKFDFPWPLAKTWPGTLKLLEQAFEMYEPLAQRVRDKRFDLLGPEKQMLLPSTWENTVQPGWEVTMLMAPDHHHHHHGHHGIWAMESRPHKSKHKSSSSSSKDKKKHRSGSSSKKHKSSGVIVESAEFPPGATAAFPTAPLPAGLVPPGAIAPGQLFGEGGLPPVPPLAPIIKGKAKKRASGAFGGLFGKKR